jgi:hypothetical protein
MEAEYLSVEDFNVELKKLLSKIRKDDIAIASEDMIKIAVEAREDLEEGGLFIFISTISTNSQGCFEFELESGDTTYTSVAKRKKLHTLNKIRDFIRETLPSDGLAEGEKVLMPFGSDVCYLFSH